MLTEGLREEALTVVRELQQYKVDAPHPLIARLVRLMHEIDKAGEQELYKRFQVVLLVVAPVEDHDWRPEGFAKFAELFLIEIEKELRRTAA